MRSFTLTVAGESADEAKRIEFNDYDLTRVFFLLEREPAGRTAILWEGDRHVATLRRTRIGGWQLAS